jgi:hypothetical protein
MNNYILIGLGILIFIFLIILIFLISKTSKLQKRLDHLLNGTSEKNIEDAIFKTFEKLENLKTTIIRNDEEIKFITNEMKSQFSKYGFLTYNAHEDAGGKVSFVFCLLTKDNNGVIVNSMHSRTGTRIYAKEVQKGEYSGNLSNEEGEALTKAISA